MSIVWYTGSGRAGAARVICGLLLLFCAALPAAAVDFGLTLDQSVFLDDAFSGDINKAGYTGMFSPWLSGLLIEDGDLYLSLGITPIVENGKFFIVPELLRSEVTLRSERGATFKFGRMSYVDPLGLIARGLFDGLEVSQDIGGGVLSMGGWFTGLQYKKSANITVSPLDESGYYTEFDSANIKTYFASRRILAAIGYEHPAIDEVIRLRLAALGQFDVNGEDDTYHSEYFTGKLNIPYKHFLLFDIGAALELLQTPDRDHSVGFAGELGASWMPPTAITDRLTLTGRYASGWVEDSPIGAFSPLTTVAQGNVLKAKLSGLAHIRTGYTVRLHETFSIDLAASYFLRTAKAKNTDGTGAVDDEDARYALGGEGYFGMVWSPVSDIRVNFGSGVFLPRLGDISPTDRSRWLFELGVSAALF